MGLVRPLILALLAGAVLAGCTVKSSSDKPVNADKATVQEFLDGSIPVENDAADAFFRKHAKECPNVDLSAGFSSEFFDRIRTQALGADGSEKLSTVLLSFCAKP